MMSPSRRLASAPALLVGLGALALATLAPLTPASAQELRFTTTQPGSVIAVGNTLGLSKASGSVTPALGNGPGTLDSIGTFLSLDPNDVDIVPLNAGNPWGAGTTNDWTQNGSTATVSLPSGEAEVLYAELVWGGSWADSGSTLTDAQLDTPVTLSFGNDSVQVAPDAQTSVKVGDFCSGNTGALCRYYVRSAEVTNFIASHGAGTYAVQGVPATQHEQTNTINAAGWTLIIAYRFDGEPIRNMSVFVGGIFVNEDTTIDYPVDGFCAPPETPFAGSIAVSTLEGDANRVGDQLAIGETPADPTFVLLDGPNNPVNNFFCSQINGPDGQLDTSGTYGSENHLNTDTNPNFQQNTNNQSGARQGWDVTTVPLSSTDGHLVANQTSAVLRTQTTSDSYMPLLAGIGIDVNAPNFTYDNATTVVDKDSVAVGDSFTLTVKAENTGFATAQDVLFTVAVPSGVSLTNFTTNGNFGDIIGNAVTLPQLTSGVQMGDITTSPPNNVRTVAVTLQVTAAQSADIVLKPIWSYTYEMCAGFPIDEVFKAPIVSVDVEGAGGEGGGGTGGFGGAGGGGTGGEGAQGGAGGAGGGDDGGAAIAEGGGLFSCSTGGGDTGSGLALVGLGAVLAAAARRRRRG